MINNHQDYSVNINTYSISVRSGNMITVAVPCNFRTAIHDMHNAMNCGPARRTP